MAASSPSSARSRAASRPRRIGSEQPRIFTPPLRKLTPKTTLGFAAIEFAEDVCSVELYPWQKWLLIHALELLPDGKVGRQHEHIGQRQGRCERSGGDNVRRRRRDHVLGNVPGGASSNDCDPENDQT